MKREFIIIQLICSSIMHTKQNIKVSKKLWIEGLTNSQLQWTLYYRQPRNCALIIMYAFMIYHVNLYSILHITVIEMLTIM